MLNKNKIGVIATDFEQVLSKNSIAELSVDFQFVENASLGTLAAAYGLGAITGDPFRFLP